MNPVVIGEYDLTIDSSIQVTRQNAKVDIAKIAIEKNRASKEFLDDEVNKGYPIYGVNTGYGTNADIIIPEDKLSELPYKITGFLAAAPDYNNCIDKYATRAVMLARLNSLAQGHSGVKTDTLELIVSFLNKRIHPRIPISGSCGASGDLVPLQYLTRSLIGRGEVEYNGTVMPTKNAMEKTGLKPINLDPKEGLAIVNGTSYMTGMAIEAYESSANLVLLADALTAYLNEVLLGTIEAFEPEIGQVRPHPGQIESAANIKLFSTESELIADFHEQREALKRMTEGSSDLECLDHRVQPLYSLRTAPQVLGAIRDLSISNVKKIIEIELNSVTDNPLLFPDIQDYRQGGNFQGSHISMAMDSLRLGISNLAKFQEAQYGMLLAPYTGTGLPRALVKETGFNGGYQGTEIANTSLLPRIIKLAIPTSNMSSTTDRPNQDIVSMGAESAKDAMEIAYWAGWISSYLPMALSQAIDCRKEQGKGPDKLGYASKMIYDHVRNHVDFLEEDGGSRLDKDLKKVFEHLVNNGYLAKQLNNYLHE